MRKFCLRVTYGTGKTAMVVDTCDLEQAIKLFKEEYAKTLPDTKMYGLPDILEAEIFPLMYQNIYKED